LWTNTCCLQLTQQRLTNNTISLCSHIIVVAAVEQTNLVKPFETIKFSLVMIMGHLLGDSNLQKLKHGSYSYSYFTVENFFV